MIALFHEHYKVRYAPRGLASWIFYIFSLLLVLAGPVLIGLAMGNFWLQTNTLVATPDIHFTDRCVVHYTTVRGQDKLWTCSHLFNEEYIYTQSEMAVEPFFSIYEDDRDDNGHVDRVTFVLQLPLNDFNGSLQEGMPVPTEKDAIKRVEFLPEFTYEIKNYILKVRMTAAPLLIFEAAEDCCSSSSSTTTKSTVEGPLCARTEGDLLFHSTEPLSRLPNVHYTNTYMNSPLENVSDVEELQNVPYFASQYTSRNQTVLFKPYSVATGGLSILQDVNYNRVLGEDLGALGDFTWRITMRIQRAEILYTPSIQEALKWAWVQYYCIAVILQFLLWWLRGILVKAGLLGSVAIFHRGWMSTKGN
ncbi:uncharacterized protein TM35_000142500 [Trypanosoma theileri]|uniref:Transmembrane protein 231 n=1 Tax=Trypanosoma theileri TaxID=67003 RepID=A0A1X0NXU0_9TRYP|nr:uncharacterized protein TM35_000142500 [Trypanosoma theileri]ORC89039.1 hypothetical protein TM35_000142500 [Trypanosoma theileri]